MKRNYHYSPVLIKGNNIINIVTLTIRIKRKPNNKKLESFTKCITIPVHYCIYIYLIELSPLYRYLFFLFKSSISSPQVLNTISTIPSYITKTFTTAKNFLFQYPIFFKVVHIHNLLIFFLELMKSSGNSNRMPYVYKEKVSSIYMVLHIHTFYCAQCTNTTYTQTHIRVCILFLYMK